MKPVAVEDLLGREPIKVNMDEIFQYLKGKTILVTGGGGSIGSELCRQIASHNPKQLIIFDIYENNAYDIEQELKRKYKDLNLKVLIGSVRDSRRINMVFEQYHPDIVYHAAAHKHVPLMETSPNEAIKNNVIGTYKTAYAAMKYGVQRFVLISTDKAVNPTNIMGASKRLCEMVVQSMDAISKAGRIDLLPFLHAHMDKVIDGQLAGDPLDHMAAWNTVPAAPEIEAATVPYQPEEPVQSEQPEQLGFDVPQGEEPLRYVGEVFRTYILAERGDELCLIDKHAAHERQLHEKLAANYGNVPSQLLLQPAAIDLSAEEKQALLENQPLLENAGLDVADFGGSTVLLRAVPADVEPQNAEDLLVEIADRLLKGSRDALNEHTEWVLHSISCRAAIKAGDKSSPQELMALAEKILSGEVPPFCPHGRPCVLKLTRKELEKQFGRIV